MEQTRSCYSPGGAVMGNRRVPAQRLPIPDPFSRKEKQSRMSEAQVGINGEPREGRWGPPRTSVPSSDLRSNASEADGKRDLPPLCPCQVMVPETSKQMACSALQVCHLLGVLVPPSSSSLALLRMRGGSEEGCEQKAWTRFLDG